MPDTTTTTKDKPMPVTALTDMTIPMLKALRCAARHPDGMIQATRPTIRALKRRGFIDGAYISESGRQTISEIDQAIGSRTK